MSGHAVVRLIASLGIVAAAAAAPLQLTGVQAEKGCGDVNKDGVVNSIDASIILQVDAGLHDPGLILINAWDLYPNGMVDSRDALIVLQYDAGIIGEDAISDCYTNKPI